MGVLWTCIKIIVDLLVSDPYFKNLLPCNTLRRNSTGSGFDL